MMKYNLKKKNKPLTNRTQKEEQINQIKQNFKSKGGDPHGALQKLENEELEQLRMEQAQSRQSENVSNIDLFIISRIIEKAFRKLKKMSISIIRFLLQKVIYQRCKIQRNRYQK